MRIKQLINELADLEEANGNDIFVKEFRKIDSEQRIPVIAAELYEVFETIIAYEREQERK